MIRYEGGKDDRVGWEDVKIMVVRPSDPDPNGPCTKYDTADDFPIARLHPGNFHFLIKKIKLNFQEVDTWKSALPFA